MQRYILREMGRIFLLASLALTAMLGLGGGVMNMIELGDVSPAQLLRLLGLVLPVAAALTLPVAALFSAAATYGRIAADNEFIACRSGGINLHVLLLPTALLGLISALTTFAFTNFVIPGMVLNLNEFISADIGSLIQRRLNRPRGITLGGRFRIHTDHTVIDAKEPNKVHLHRVVFVEVDGDEWVRFGTAREVSLEFKREQHRVRTAGWMTGLSYYDRKLGQFVEEGEQIIPPNDLPALVPLEIKFLKLGELLRYWHHPDDWREVRSELRRLRMAVGRAMVHQAMWEDWRRDQVIHLRDDQGWFEVRSVTAARLPRGGGIELSDVLIDGERRGQSRHYSAKRVIVEVAPGDTLSQSGVRIQAYAVTAQDSGRTFERSKATLGPVAIPSELVRRTQQLTDEELLDPTAGWSDDDAIARKQRSATEIQGETIRKIVATLNQRCAFSVSVLVLVVLGAALGIVFRGSHLVMAFGISFVPSLFVIITIVMGKQMAQNSVTYLSGLAVMWAGIVLVAGLDAWILKRVLRR